MKCLLIYLFAGFIFFTSCKDNCEETGTGGNFTIAAFPKHDNNPIVSEALPGYPDSAWIKFNSGDFPGPNPSDFDLILVAEAGENHIHIEGLKCGNYFIYITGWDVAQNVRVKGGIAYTIPADAPSEIDLDIPVSQ